jgi:hypothetical protein
MRRVSVAFILAAGFELLVPAPANAWWEWVDRLSGPGRFNGPQFEVRLVCFGDHLPLHEELKLVADAEEQTETAKASAGNEAVARTAWTEAAYAWKAAAEAWKRVAARLSSQSEHADKLEKTLAPPLAADPLETLEGKANNWRQVALDRARASNSTVTAMSAMGVIWAACPDEKIRRASIDLGVGIWRAAGETGYAGGRAITLTTLVPSFSWRVFSDPRYDFLDAAIGAGVYWFTSPGFTSFSGVILEPGRLDVHAPSSWSSKPFKNPKRWAALPTFRVGLLVFPGGFERNVFAATGQKAVRIPAELTRAYSLFLNLEPLVRHWTRQSKP